MNFSKSILPLLRTFDAVSNPLQVMYCRAFRKQGIMTVRVKDSDTCMKMRVSTYSMFAETWLNHDYDTVYVPIREGDVVIDVGANQGFYTCYAASKGATVYSFEPFSKSFDLLQENVKLNGQENRVKLFEMAIGANNGKRQLFEVDKLGGGMNTIEADFVKFADTIGVNATPVGEVFCTTLEEVIQENNITAIRICKLDCEGSELEILRSLPLHLVQKIDVFVIEFHPNYPLQQLAGIVLSWGTHQLSYADPLPHCQRTIMRVVANHLFV